ncbi:MAG TPA: toxin [Candidatus Xenobia bacterium]|jgi:hypothetical protein
MKAVFVETPWFTRYWEDYFASDKEYSAFQAYLMENPEAGDVVQGCGGIRKVRWGDPKRGKGKRGGIRILYMRVPAIAHFVILVAYDKDETDDLTTEQRAVWAELARTAAEELTKKVKGRKHE